MTTEGATVREQTRRRVRRAKPSRATRDLLARYQDRMRSDLDMILRMLRPDTLSIAERPKYWDLGITLARELGNEIETAPPAEEPQRLRPTGTGADFG